MLDSYLFSLRGSHGGRNMHEVPLNLAIFINFFFGSIGLCWDSKYFLFLDFDHHECWVGIVPAEEFIDLDVVLFDPGSTGVPPNDSFLCVYLFKHVVHVFVIHVINKPNVGVVQILLKGNRITIRNIKYAFVVFTWKKVGDECETYLEGRRSLFSLCLLPIDCSGRLLIEVQSDESQPSWALMH